VQILHRVGGRPVFTVRSHDEERKNLESLRARLPERCDGLEAMLSTIEVLRQEVEQGRAVVQWPQSVPRVVGSASWNKLRLRVSTERDWFGIRGSIEIDGVEITLRELLEAQRRRDRFIAVGPDDLVELSDEMRAQLASLDAIARPTKDGLAIVGAAVPALVDLVPREHLDAAPPFWDLLQRVDAAQASEPKVPPAFSKILRPYQAEGFRWMSRLAAWGAGGCLADEMGLGKTVQTLALLTSRKDHGPALVIAPTSVGPNWMGEAKHFAPSLRAILHRGADRALDNPGPGDVVVTSYDILVRDGSAIEAITWDTVVVDEAQAIKNGDTARARAVRSLRASFRLALTGTPVENRLSELYSLMQFLNPGFFGSEEEFRARWIVPIERDKDAERSDALARVVRPFLLRRKKSDVLSELPARTEIARTIELGPQERRMYEAARRIALAAIAGADEDGRFRILAEITRLRRLACHPRLYDETSKVPSSKLEAFLSLVTELREAGHRALVFSQFTGHLALVEEALRARSHSLSLSRRQDAGFGANEAGGGVSSGGGGSLLDLAQGGGHRPQPHGRGHGHPPRSLVEPGRRRSSHRSRAPNRSDAAGHGHSPDRGEHDRRSRLGAARRKARARRGNPRGLGGERQALHRRARRTDPRGRRVPALGRRRSVAVGHALAGGLTGHHHAAHLRAAAARLVGLRPRRPAHPHAGHVAAHAVLLVE
jgi:hypothetical protein